MRRIEERVREEGRKGRREEEDEKTGGRDEGVKKEGKGLRRRREQVVRKGMKAMTGIEEEIIR